MTETVLVREVLEIGDRPPAVHLRWDDERNALCGYVFPISDVDRNHDIAENDCVVCQEIFAGMSR
jgi:hypothetical protein